MTTQLRNADLTQLSNVLQSQIPLRHDFVVPASSLRMEDGRLVASEATHEITDDGVTTVPADRHYDLSNVAAEQLAERCGIPLVYWRRMAGSHNPLLDRNVNTWLAEDGRTFFVRTFSDRNADGPGIVRAVLSDRFAVMEDFDVLLAALDGARQAGLSLNESHIKTDLTDRRMFVRITVPEISVNVADLLGHYRSAITGNASRDLPLMWAGLVISNSEIGHGAFTIAPRAVLQVCTNGMTRNVDLVRAVHLGGRMEAGAITWSADTQRRQLGLVVARARDAVSAFLSTDYLAKYVADMQRAANVQVNNPVRVMQVVAKQMRYSEAQAESILSHFTRGGDLTALGFGHALTSVASTTDDADAAAEMEADFFRIVDLAAGAALSN